METVVVEKSRIGRIAALVTVVLYVVASAILFIGAIMEDGNDDDNALGNWMYIIFTACVFLGTIAAVVALWQLLKVSGVLGDALAKVALVIGAVAAVGSFFSWAWPIWGLVLALAFLVGAFALRKHGHGVVGVPSSTDWAIPAAWVIGALVMWLLYVTDIVESKDEELDWAYTSGFLIGALITAITMVFIAEWLKTPARATVEPTPMEPTDGPGVAGI